MYSLANSYMVSLSPELMTDENRGITVSGYMRETNEELSKYGIDVPSEIDSIILLYTREGIYIITFQCRPLGFSCIMDSQKKNVIVSSIQEDDNIKKGMKVASRIFAVNEDVVIDMKHREILKKLAKFPTPLKIVFLKVCFHSFCIS